MPGQSSYRPTGLLHGGGSSVPGACAAWLIPVVPAGPGKVPRSSLPTFAKASSTALGPGPLVRPQRHPVLERAALPGCHGGSRLDPPGKETSMVPRCLRVVPFAAVLLIALFLVPAASAAPRREDRAVRETTDAFWRAIPYLWHSLQRIFEKEGSSLDPFGKPASVPETPSESLTLGSGTTSSHQ